MAPTPPSKPPKTNALDATYPHAAIAAANQADEACKSSTVRVARGQYLHKIGDARIKPEVMHQLKTQSSGCQSSGTHRLRNPA